jgi:sialate O-acetylesterase
VLQRNQSDPIWGEDLPGTRVTVTFRDQTKVAVADAAGNWTVSLDPMAASDQPGTLRLSGSTTREISDVLVGENWICSGQSNMEFELWRDLNAEVEVATADWPAIRLIRIPEVGSQEPQRDFKGHWMAATSASASRFSAVAFFYGRYLHQILHVPIGLIDNPWSGSSAECWISRPSLERDPRFAALMARTRQREDAIRSGTSDVSFPADLAKWEIKVAQAKAAFRPLPSRPKPLSAYLTGNERPGNAYDGMVHPIIGFGIKGVIWYQGESNVDHAAEYRTLFSFLIAEWRREWRQGDFPFYWVQLAAYDPKRLAYAPGESAWAELREAQTQTLELPNTGQAVVFDLGDVMDIHPRNKHDVAARLVRWPLARDYGQKMFYRSPEFARLEISGPRASVTFNCFGSTIRTAGVYSISGLLICGEDREWHPASGRVAAPDRIEVWSELVPHPVAVRYAWADAPLGDLVSEQGLPVTPFRTDRFPRAVAAAR